MRCMSPSRSHAGCPGSRRSCHVPKSRSRGCGKQHRIVHRQDDGSVACQASISTGSVSASGLGPYQIFDTAPVMSFLLRSSTCFGQSSASRCRVSGCVTAAGSKADQVHSHAHEMDTPAWAQTNAHPDSVRDAAGSASPVDPGCAFLHRATTTLLRSLGRALKTGSDFGKRS